MNNRTRLLTLLASSGIGLAGSYQLAAHLIDFEYIGPEARYEMAKTEWEGRSPYHEAAGYYDYPTWVEIEQGKSEAVLDRIALEAASAFGDNRATSELRDRLNERDSGWDR